MQGTRTGRGAQRTEFARSRLGDGRSRRAADHGPTPDQAEAAFDAPDPLDEEPEEPEEPDELDDPEPPDEPEPPDDDPEDDDPDDDSDVPAFTVLVVDVLRESVR